MWPPAAQTARARRGDRLTDDVRQVDAGGAGGLGRLHVLLDLGLGRIVTLAQPLDELAQVRHRDHLHVRHEDGLGGVRGGDHDCDVTVFGRAQDGGEHAAYGPDAAVEAQLSQEERLRDALGRDHARRAQDRHGYREIELGATFRQAGREEADDDAGVRPGVVAVDHRRSDAVAGLAERCVGQADEVDAGQAVSHVGLDLDRAARDSHQGDAARAGHGHLDRPPYVAEGEISGEALQGDHVHAHGLERARLRGQPFGGEHA